MKTNIIKRLTMAAVAVMAISSAVSAQSVTEGFDSFKGGYNSSWKWELTMPEGWDYTGAVNTFSTGGTYKTATPSIEIDGSNSSAYLISPKLEGEFNFWIRNYTKSYQASVKAYACTYEEGQLTLGNLLGEKTLDKTPQTTTNPVWENITFTAPTPTRVALLISRAYFDDFTYTPAVEKTGPSLAVKDYPNGSTYNFGGVEVPAGTRATFNLVNQGTEELTITNISVTGGYSLVSNDTEFSIEAGKTADVVIATPDYPITSPDRTTTGVLTIESNDPENGVYTIDLSSVYKVPKPVMEVTPSSINFGKVTEDATRTISISNSGDAELIATVTSSNEAFVVSESEVTVYPNESKEITVTYRYDAESYGVHSATITITPTNEECEPFSVSVTAKVADPNVWSEDFDNNQLPAGWEADDRVWKFTDDVARGKYDYYIKSYLTTPSLKVVTGDELTFQYYVTGNYVDINIQYSKDGGDFQDYRNISNLNTNDTGSYTISNLEDGTYRFRFQNDNYDLDNFEGFKLALKDHEIKMDVVIPQTAYQYVPYTTSVTVRELLGKEENVTAALYIEETVVSEQTFTLGAQKEEVITLSYTPIEAAENVEAYILLTYAEGETLQSDVVNVTVKAAPAFDESEGESSFNTGEYPAIVLNYTPVKGWNTITVPFALNDTYLTTIFGSGYSVFELMEFADGFIKFQYPSRGLVAGYPYIVYSNGEAAETRTAQDGEQTPDRGILLYDVNIEKTSPEYDQKNGVRFNGIFSKATATGSEYLVNPASAKLEKANNGDDIQGFRGYITLPAEVTGVPELQFLDGNGVPTGITAVSDPREQTKTIFNLQGMPVKEPLTPGIYIINGKKTILK